MSLNVGVVGTGMIGTEHARRTALEIGGATLAGVYDVDTDRARALSAELGGTSFASAGALIADPAIDAVILASPSPLHAAQVLACIAAGKPVLCEKPLATTVEDAACVLDAEVAGGRRLVQVGFMRRYDRALRAVKTAIDDGSIGEPVLAHAVHRNPEAPPGFRSEQVPTDVLIHEFDQFRWLLGQEVVAATAVRGRSTPLGPAGLRDPQVLLLELADGALVELEAYVSCRYGYDVRCEVVGSLGAVELENPADAVLSTAGQRGAEVPADWRVRFGEAYRTELQEWVNGVLTGTSRGPSAWDGYAASAVAAAAVESLGSGSRVPVLMVERPGLYR